MVVSCVPSDLLIKANQRLLERRQACVAVRAKSDTKYPDSHGDGNWALHNAQKQLQAYRQRDLKIASTREPAYEFNLLTSGVGGAEPPQSKTSKQSVRHYPSIGIGAIECEATSQYRVWLLCRHLDPAGRGWLDCSALKSELTDADSPLRIFSWRRLRQILAKGNGRLWTWDKHNGRLWLYGAARLAASLNVYRLSGKPVDLPLNILVEGIGAFRAHLYGAFHSGRKISNPMSRQTQRELLSIPESTQRHYCRVANIPRQQNMAIGDRNSPENVEEGAYRHGKGCFTFCDVKGLQGAKNSLYVAWQLPVTHKAIHATASNGRKKKINRKLSDLVNLRAQGNREQPMTRIFHANGAEAVKAVGYDRTKDIYWLWNKSSKGVGVWMRVKGN